MATVEEDRLDVRGVTRGRRRPCDRLTFGLDAMRETLRAFVEGSRRRRQRRALDRLGVDLVDECRRLDELELGMLFRIVLAAREHGRHLELLHELLGQPRVTRCLIEGREP